MYLYHSSEVQSTVRPCTTFHVHLSDLDAPLGRFLQLVIVEPQTVSP